MAFHFDCQQVSALDEKSKKFLTQLRKQLYPEQSIYITSLTDAITFLNNPLIQQMITYDLNKPFCSKNFSSVDEDEIEDSRIYLSYSTGR